MDSIVGHHGAKHILKTAMDGGRMHHAWIFHGRDGIGKRSLAIEVARILLCHSPTDMIPCRQCPSCRLDMDAHPDLHTIHKELAGDSQFRHLRERKQLNIPVDLLRERMLGGYVRETYIDPIVGMRPMMNHNKIFIIDEAERLDRFGQNVLLKTLEEPPDGTYLFLITSNEERLLPTMRSRCQRIAFQELSKDEISNWILESVPNVLTELNEQIAQLSAQKRISKERKEKLNHLRARVKALENEPQVIEVLTQYAAGSLGRVKRMLRYGQFQWPGIIEPIVRRMADGQPDIDAGSVLFALVQADAVDWVDDHKNASKEAANRAAVGMLFTIINEICRRKLRQIARKHDPADSQEMEMAAHPWLTGIEQIRDAERSLASNVNLALLIDNLCIQWSCQCTPLRTG